MRIVLVKLEKRHIVLRCGVQEGEYQVGDLVVIGAKDESQMAQS